MEYIEDICEIGKKAGKLLKEINRSEDIKVSDAPSVKELMSVVEKSMNIKRMDEEEDVGYSHGGDWMAEGTYGRGSSHANRGKHYVHGHYSRDGGYSSRRDGRGRDSHGDGRSEMMEYIEMAIEAADGQDKETLKRFMRQLENA